MYGYNSKIEAPLHSDFYPMPIDLCLCYHIVKVIVRKDFVLIVIYFYKTVIRLL